MFLWGFFAGVCRAELAQTHRAPGDLIKVTLQTQHPSPCRQERGGPQEQQPCPAVGLVSVEVPQLPAWHLERSREIPSGTGFYGSFLTSELWWLCQAIGLRWSITSHPRLLWAQLCNPTVPSDARSFNWGGWEGGSLEGIWEAGRDWCSWKGFGRLEGICLPIIQLAA